MAIATCKQLITEQINHICCGYTFYSLHRPDTSKLYDSALIPVAIRQGPVKHNEDCRDVDMETLAKSNCRELKLN